MSYILDALKKAEAERDPDARATLAIAEQSRRRNRTLAYGVLIALIINAGVLLWLFFPEPTTDAETIELGLKDQSSPTAAEIPPQTRPQPQPQPQPATAQQTRPVQPNTSNALSAEPATGNTIIGPGSRSVAGAEPAALASLPADVRNRFPVLEFSTHIYADEADLRALVVNGVRLEEGDRLEGLRVQEITEEGAVFEFEGRLVAVSVLDGWN